MDWRVTKKNIFFFFMAKEMCPLMLVMSSECNKNLEDEPKLAHADTFHSNLKWNEQEGINKKKTT